MASTGLSRRGFALASSASVFSTAALAQTTPPYRVAKTVALGAPDASFLSMATGVARFHHERFDGQGVVFLVRRIAGTNRMGVVIYSLDVCY